MQFGGESPDSASGGHTNAGLITDKRLKISYHGARTVTGGTPFSFNDRSDAHPFGTFKEVEKGGKIVVMGDGMVSLYMTSWEGVQDYQCQEFMQARVSMVAEVIDAVDIGGQPPRTAAAI